MMLTEKQAEEYRRLMVEDVARRAVAAAGGDPNTVASVAEALAVRDNGSVTGPSGEHPLEVARAVAGEGKKTPPTRKLSEMTEREKMDYLDEFGLEAYTELVVANGS